MRRICSYSPSKCTFHEHSEGNSHNNKDVCGGGCVAFCLCCYCKCGLTFALQAAASGTVLHVFAHHDNMAVPSRRISGPLYPDAREADLSHVTHVENGTHKSILGRRWMKRSSVGRSPHFCSVVWLHLLAFNFSAGTCLNLELLTTFHVSLTTLEFTYMAA